MTPQTLIEQPSATGVTAWLAAVGLAHLSRPQLDPVDAAMMAGDGLPWPSWQAAPTPTTAP